MPVRDLNKEQKNAASSTGSEIIVSAGAGSGKTRLLVSRYLYLVLMEKLPLSSIAAITFTNKAADQMKSKVAQEASKLADLYSNDKDFWLHVTGEVNFAKISTIHSFCSSILRSYSIESGIDPFFTIIEEFAAEKLKTETIESYLTGFMSEQPENASFILDTFGIGGLKKILRTLLTKRIKVLKFLDGIHSNGYLEPEALESLYKTNQLSVLDDYIGTLNSFHALSPAEDLMTDLCENLINALVRIRAMVNGNSVDEAFIFETIKNINLRCGSSKKWGENNLESARSEMGECRDFLKTLRFYYKYEKGRTAKSASILMVIFSDLENNYLERKKSLSFLDNDDILIETWKLLRNNSNLCGKISKSFRHILVDEFQDTDDLQMDILRMITGNSSASLFVVGDEKQSIYRFRGADVTVFGKILSNPSIESFHLDMNYRSVPGILDFVNTSFSRIMGKEPVNKFEAHYSADMKANRRDNGQSPSVEITVFSGNSELRRKSEADYIAGKALELREKYNFRDMALLLRGRTAMEIYEEALLRNKVPFINLAGSKVPGSPEVYDIGNLLGWIGNPGDPGLLVSVLLSPFFNADPDTLLILRDIAGSPEKMGTLVFYEQIAHSQMNKIPSRLLKSFDILKELHAMSERVSIAEIIRYALDKTNYSQVVLANPIKGERSLSVIDLLLRSADSFEKNGGNMREFADILLSGEEFTEESAVIESTGDSLQIMTIHGVKGLEYKVVFLADLSYSKGRGNGDIFFNEELGPGFKILDARGIAQDTYVSSRSSGFEKKKDIAESKRLFYVGCTRAKDHLVITGAIPPLSPDPFYEKDNWMTWIHTAHDLHVTESDCVINEKLFRYESVTGEVEIPPGFLTEKWHEALQSDSCPVNCENEELFKLLSPAKQIKESTLPQKLSPTELINYIECPAFYYLQSIKGIDAILSVSENGDGGPEYGVFVHRVMASLDFYNTESWNETTEKSEGKNFPGNFRERIHDELSILEKSAFYDRLMKAEKIKREETFAFIQDDVLIRGTADLVYSENGNIIIADYKTDRGEPEKLKERISGYRLQLGIYALAYNRAKYINPGLLTLYYTATGENIDIACDEDFLKTTEKIVSDAVKSISDGNFNPKKCGKCQYCIYREICCVNGCP